MYAVLGRQLNTVSPPRNVAGEIFAFSSAMWRVRFPVITSVLTSWRTKFYNLSEYLGLPH
jgi:hypothetical protein